MSNTNLPIGWGDRHNAMSEKDIQLGGMAATKFATNKKKGAYQNSPDDLTYKTSDDVRAYYLSQMSATEDPEKNQSNHNNANDASSLPLGWENREKEKQIQATQQGVFAAAQQKPGPVPSTDDTSMATTSTALTKELPSSCLTAEVALLQVTTHSLESLAAVLEHGGTTGVSISTKERAKFAIALQRAMDALAKCR